MCLKTKEIHGIALGVGPEKEKWWERNSRHRWFGNPDAVGEGLAVVGFYPSVMFEF
jgi:hypothetical protein